MHAIRSKEPQPALEEMQKQFCIILLVPGSGIKIVKKNNSQVKNKNRGVLLPGARTLIIHLRLRSQCDQTSFRNLKNSSKA